MSPSEEMRSLAGTYQADYQKGLFLYCTRARNRQTNRAALGQVPDGVENDEEEDSLPTVLEYVFPERARLVESFYDPEAESFVDEDQLLARHIQVTKGLIAFSQFYEPDRRGK
ncbi:hypothetical protein V8E54_009694 [Elaphomyces granulatus]